MKSNPPAFQLYAADFYIDTIEWSEAELGLYLRLLLLEWINGPLPGDVKSLVRLCNTHYKTFNKLWIKVSTKFDIRGDKLVNKRLEKTREEQLKYREVQQIAGKRGVERKRELGIYPFNNSSDPSSDPATDPSSENQALQSSSSFKENNKKKKTSVPKDFKLTPELIEWAKSKGCKKTDAGFKELTEQFLDHHKAKGSLYIDWVAAWRNWVRNDIKFNGEQRKESKKTWRDRLKPII